MKICKIKGCNEKHKAFGLCCEHYYSEYRKRPEIVKRKHEYDKHYRQRNYVKINRALRKEKDMIKDWYIINMNLQNSNLNREDIPKELFELFKSRLLLKRERRRIRNAGKN